MFCHQCGTEIADGEAFCYKCGARIQGVDSTGQKDENMPTGAGQADYVNVQNVQSSPVGSAQVQLQKTVLNKAGKKTKKLPLILGIAIPAVVILAIIAAVIKGFDKDESSSRVNLSQTYTNEEEGISFQYPSAWKESDPAEYYSAADAQNSVVLLINQTEQGLNSVIEVLKYPVDQEIIEHLFVDDEEFAATFDDDVSIIETSVVKISGATARKISYIEQDELYYLSYMYGIGNALYRINFICQIDMKNTFERFYNAIIKSYSVTSEAITPPSSDTVTDDADYMVFAGALWNLVLYNTLPDGNIANDLDGKIDGMWDKFAICDINQDGTDELLIKIGSGSVAAQGQYIYQMNSDNTGLDMLYSFFTDAVYYDTGFIKENWSHNQGLSENFWPYSILQWETDGCREVAGADAWEKMAWETDFSGNPFPDDVDADGNGIVYFIGGENGIDYDNPVDDAEYNAFVKKYFGTGNEIYVPWRDLTEENIETATGYIPSAFIDQNAGDGSQTGDMALEANMPIEYYAKLAGAYSGSTPDSVIYLNIYSSQEVGEIAIGNAEIYGLNFYYYGEVVELYKDTLIVATDSGEEVLLTASEDSGGIRLVLSIDGEYIDEYWMYEHYVS